MGTNLLDFYNQIGLDDNLHDLWFVEEGNMPPTLSETRKTFLVSQEGKSAVRPREQNIILFDSAVADDNLVYPHMILWSQVNWTNRTSSLNNLTKDTNSTLVFDALLGKVRPNRMFAWNWLNQRPEIKRFGYVTYYGKNKVFHISPGKVENNFVYSALPTEHDNMIVPWSMIIPTEIYNQTWVTVVTETNSWPRGWSHFTEKIAKPMLAMRPFIVLANPGYLSRLKSLGFVTFNNIIDESYDTIENDSERWALALEQLTFFINADRVTVSQQIQEQLVHNKKLIQQDWYEIFKSQLKTLI